MRILSVISSMLLSFHVCSGQQKSIVSSKQVWLGYFNQTRLSDKSGMWVDIHFRTKEDFFTNFSQALFRAGYTYYLNDDAKLTAGYAFVIHFPADNHNNISQPEHRPWQQVQWHNRYHSVRLMQWIRLEERFRRKILNDNALASGYNYNFRARYNILAQFSIGQKKFHPGTFSFVLANEVFVNFGKQIRYNYFDQNRFFFGFHYHLNKHDNIQFGYRNIFQQLAAGDKYKCTHAARVFHFHNLDLRRPHSKF